MKNKKVFEKIIEMVVKITKVTAILIKILSTLYSNFILFAIIFIFLINVRIRILYTAISAVKKRVIKLKTAFDSKNRNITNKRKKKEKAKN